MFFRVQVLQGPGFSGSRFFRVQVFQGPGPGSRVRVQDPGPESGSKVRVQVQGPGPGFRSSRLNMSRVAQKINTCLQKMVPVAYKYMLN